MFDYPSPRSGSVLDRLPPEARIAVVRPGRLGDVLVLTPALAALRRCMPHAHITYLADEAGVTLRDHLPWVDEVIIMPPGHGDPAHYHLDQEMSAFFRRMHHRAFDLALQCAGGGDTMNPFVLALGARVTAGQDSDRAPSLDLCMPFQRPLQAESLRLMDVMGLVGVPPGDPRPVLPILPSDVVELSQEPGLPRAALESGRLIGVHVGSQTGSRRWAPVRYAAVLDALLADEAGEAVLLGGPGEEPIAGQVLDALRQRDRVHDLSGRLSLNVLIALLPHLRLLLANDSFPGHLAAALDVPAVLIYGSGHPGTWAPALHLWQRPVADISAPCRIPGQSCNCPDDSTARCIAGVPTERVLAEARALLAVLDASTSLPTLARRASA